MSLFTVFTEEGRDINRLAKRAEKVLALKDSMRSLSNEELGNKTTEFKERLSNGEMLDKILEEAFAVAKEATYRIMGFDLHKEQIMAGICLFEGNVAEQKTGEGKSLTVVMPTYLEALAGEGVHVVTVNEYLCNRDAMQARSILSLLNLKVGTNLRDLDLHEKQAVYNCDITYTTNAELGFDYLRDNMITDAKRRVIRKLHVAFVDEADSVLIDEARTPLIISGGKKKTAQIYSQCDAFVKTLEKPVYETDPSTKERKVVSGDYDIDNKTQQVMLTEDGIKKAEKYFKVPNLYDADHSQLVHHVNQALKANYVMTKGVEYIVNKDEEVLLVDQFTGRVLPGRSYSDGLQQAIQAKEGVEIEEETSTLATITYQNFFRLYDKLAGMTGTAKTEEEEFLSTYNMEVVCVPTHKPVARIDEPDKIYLRKSSKYKGLVEETKELYEKGQPVLIGTVAVETSELIHNLLEREGIPHQVLNAKNHVKEAEIIAKAGYPKAVTIATNMAGRGTDIKLTEESRALGGLVVLGSERHESRRIDNQLRGRSGRQGDPGRSQFYVSMEDDLVARFGSEKIRNMLLKSSDDDDTPLTSKYFSKVLTSTQKQAEGYNFDSRKNVLDYDDVLRRQREIIYKERNEILDSENTHDRIHLMFEKTIDLVIENNVNGSKKGKFDANELCRDLDMLGMEINNRILPNDIRDMKIEDARNYIQNKIWKDYEKMIEPVKERFMEFEKNILLKTIDRCWIDHIDLMGKLRSGIHLRSYAQNDPLQQYVKEGFQLFESMNKDIDRDVTKTLLMIRIYATPLDENPNSVHVNTMAGQETEGKEVIG